jgi:hypothetical protein
VEAAGVFSPVLAVRAVLVAGFSRVLAVLAVAPMPQAVMEFLLQLIERWLPEPEVDGAQTEVLRRRAQQAALGVEPFS